MTLISYAFDNTSQHLIPRPAILYIYKCQIRPNVECCSGRNLQPFKSVCKPLARDELFSNLQPFLPQEGCGKTLTALPLFPRQVMERTSFTGPAEANLHSKNVPCHLDISKPPTYSPYPMEEFYLCKFFLQTSTLWNRLATG